MSYFSKIQTTTTLINTGLVPIFYHPEIKTVKNVTDALSKGGTQVIELTNRGDGADNLFKEAISYIRKEHPHIITGAGTVRDAQTAAIYIQAGADFIVSPSFQKETASLCNRRQIPYLPGCQTINEIETALEAGCDIIKLFPAQECGGPAFIKAVSGPIPRLMIMATGGIDTSEESIKTWFESGIACAGMGSKLIPKEDLLGENYNAITTRTRMALSLIEKYKKT